MKHFARKIDLARLANDPSSDVSSMVEELESLARRDPADRAWSAHFVSAPPKAAPRWRDRFIAAATKTAPTRH